MQRLIIRYNGLAPVVSSNEVFKETNGQQQHWHFKTINDSVGIEFRYDYEDIEISDKIIEPFVELNNNLYSLTVKTNIKTSDGFNLLILPTVNSYFDELMPRAIPQSIQTDWFPGDLCFIFGRSKKTKFCKGQAFAQALVVPRGEYEVVPMTEKEKDHNLAAEEHIKNTKYATRNWITANGTSQDNQYEIIANLAELGKLPFKQPSKKLRLIK